MTQWPYPYCPHQAYNKNKQIRLNSIPYSFVPDPTIDAFTNLNIKSANLNKHNIPTLAYEDWFCSNKDVFEDTNYVKDFYLEVKGKNQTKLDNEIIDLKCEQLAEHNAYKLAETARIDYQNFEASRRNALFNARNRAMSTYREFENKKLEDKRINQQKNGEWLRKLYRKLEEVARHIVEGQGQSQSEKEKMFLLSKGNLTSKYLSQIKVRNPKTAFEILQQLRTLMRKKKLKYEDERQDQQKNKSVSMSYTSDVSQNTSQGSMLSEATSLNQSNIDGEQAIISQFSNFDQLKKKWKVQDIEMVKYLLRVSLSRSIVSEAELNAVKKRREAQKINAKFAKSGFTPLKQKSVNKSKAKTKSKQKIKNIIPIEQKNMKQNKKLTKQELNIKQKLLKGGQFDSTGQKFSRNRNFSSLFSNRQSKVNMAFSLKQDLLNSERNNKEENLESTINLSKI